MREVACPTCTVHLQVILSSVHNTNSQMLLAILSAVHNTNSQMLLATLLLVPGELTVNAFVPFGQLQVPTSGSETVEFGVCACLPCQCQLIRRDTVEAIEIILLIIWLFFVLHITKREFCPLGHVHEWILIAGYMLRIQIEFVED
jgi:hypothetical protein